MAVYQTLKHCNSMQEIVSSNCSGDSELFNRYQTYQNVLSQNVKIIIKAYAYIIQALVKKTQT